MLTQFGVIGNSEAGIKKNHPAGDIMYISVLEMGKGGL